MAQKAGLGAYEELYWYIALSPPGLWSPHRQSKYLITLMGSAHCKLLAAYSLCEKFLWDWDISQWVRRLPSMHKVRGPTLRTVSARHGGACLSLKHRGGEGRRLTLGCIASYMASSRFPFAVEGTAYHHPEIPHSVG